MRALILLSLVLLTVCGRSGDLLFAQAQAAAPADQLAQLRTLTKGHVYRGSTYAERILYKRETVKDAQFDASKGWLGIRVDDVDETAPVTVIVPLRDVNVIGWGGQAPAIKFSCNTPLACITTTAESFAQAVQKLAAGQGAALKFSTRWSGYQFGCAADKCAAIKQAIDQLASLPLSPGSSAPPAATVLPQPPSGQASPRTPTPAELVAKINTLSGRLDYVAPDGTRVLAYRYATALDTRTMQLVITRDVQSFVAANPAGSRTHTRTTIPLAQVSAVTYPDRVHEPRNFKFAVHEVGFVCHEKKHCIQASDQTSRNVYQGHKYECDASKCAALQQALGQLVVAARAAPAAAPTAPPPAKVRR